MRENTKDEARHAVEMCLATTGVGEPDLTIAPEAKELSKEINEYNKTEKAD